MVRKPWNSWNILGISYISWNNPWKESLIVAGPFKNLESGLIVIYYVLYNNFFYTHLPSAFVPQKKFYHVDDDTDAFLLFVLQ